jgi:hypothetical protein
MPEPKWQPRFRSIPIPNDGVSPTKTIGIEVSSYEQRVLGFADDQLRTADPEDVGAMVAIIVVSGTACEIGFARCLDNLLRTDKLGERRTLRHRIERLLSPANGSALTMYGSEQREVWEDATGDRLSKCEWWADYTEHVMRRNRIAHAGLLPDDTEPNRAAAEASVSVARVVHRYQEGVSRRLGLPPF